MVGIVLRGWIAVFGVLISSETAFARWGAAGLFV